MRSILCLKATLFPSAICSNLCKCNNVIVFIILVQFNADIFNSVELKLMKHILSIPNKELLYVSKCRHTGNKISLVETIFDKNFEVSHCLRFCHYHQAKFAELVKSNLFRGVSPRSWIWNTLFQTKTSISACALRMSCLFYV